MECVARAHEDKTGLLSVRSAAWERTSLGWMRSEVQILSHRPTSELYHRGLDERSTENTQNFETTWVR